MDFTQFLTQTYSESNRSDHLHSLVQTKFSIGTRQLDNHHQSVWQVINRSVQCVLVKLSPTVN